MIKISTKDLIVTDRQKIREKWGKSEQDVKKDIQILKDWLKTQKHLPEISSDNMIEFLLTNCKFSIEKTKTHLDMYYSIRSMMPDFYDNNHPNMPDHQNIYDVLEYVVLPKLTENLYRISVMKFKEDSADRLIPMNLLTYGSNIYEIRVQEDLVMGEVFVIDCKYFTMAHIVKFTPTLLKTYLLVLEKVWSNRLKEIHLINYPSAINVFMTIAKSIFKKKLYERIFLHPTYDSVLEKIPQEMLPTDYGGKEKSLSELTELWKQKFEEYSDRFDKILKMRVDESLRPVPLCNSEILGYYGNFKKLDVD